MILKSKLIVLSNQNGLDDTFHSENWYLAWSALEACMSPNI